MSKSNILIVDDTLKNVQLLGSILFDEGYEIAIAMNGKEALELVKDFTPDLILLDIMMPELDGFQTCQKLKEIPGFTEIPVIFLSAKTEIEDITKGFEIGGVDYISKPFNKMELLKRIETHIELRESHKKITSQNNELKEMIHLLSHDLNNPLGFISSIIDLVKTSDEKIEDHLSDMDKSIKRSLEIIQLTKNLRAVEDKKFTLDIQKVNLLEALNESLNVLTFQFKKKGISILLSVDDKLEIFVEKNIFINSILNNLLTNAIKFSDMNSSIEISAREIANKIYIMIQDSGIGIPEEMLSKIFDIGASISRKGTMGEEGTGFGLPMVKKFIEAFNAEIVIDSRELPQKNHGTTIKLYFPKKTQNYLISPTNNLKES